jgi:hypothetical protein
MARSSAYGVGSIFAARGVTSLEGRIVVPSGSVLASVSFPLLTEGLPYLNVWCRQVTPTTIGESAKVSLKGSVRPLGLDVTGSKNSARQAAYVTLATWIMPINTGVTPFAPGGLLFPVSKVILSVTAALSLEDTVIDFVIYADA